MLQKDTNMQRVLILIALALYWVGCSDGNSDKVYINQTGEIAQTSQPLDTLSQTDTDNSQDTIISAYTTPDYVRLMEVAALNIEGVALDIALSEDCRFAYIAAGDRGLSVIDITDPYNPVLVSMYDTTQYVNHVEVIDGKAYVSYVAQTWNDYQSVNAFDVTDPYNLVYLGYYEGFMNNDHKTYSADGLIYYIDQEGFKVVREEDYQVIGRYDLFDTAYAFVINDGFAFIANGRNGLTVLKIN